MKLGGSRGYTANAEDIAKAREARQELARDRAQAVAPILVRIDPEGRLSLRAVAAALEAEGVPTVAGKGRWTATGVARLRERLGAGLPVRVSPDLPSFGLERNCIIVGKLSSS